MNKYFAKYLPVEGEIKEGDKACWSIRFKHIIGFEGGAKHVQLLQEDGHEPVKLFLCSRDITSEDYKLPDNLLEDYLQKEYSRYGTGEETFDQWFNGNINWISTLGAYKVIGEISPEAIWVKEGDEFNEDEIEPYFSPKIVNKQEWKSYSVEGHRISNNTKQIVYPLSPSFSISIWDIPLNLLTHKYKIKGQCGHFH